MPELDEALDLAVEHVLRQHPVGNAAAIEAAGLRRFLEDRDRVAEARELIGRAVSGRPGSDDRHFLAVRRPGLDDVARQRLSEVAEEPLDGADGNRLVVLAAIARLLARVIADAAGHRRERHVLLDQRVGIEVFAALHQIQIALDLFVGAARVVARRHLVAIHRPDRAPVAGRETDPVPFPATAPA